MGSCTVASGTISAAFVMATAGRALDVMGDHLAIRFMIFAANVGARILLVLAAMEYQTPGLSWIYVAYVMGMTAVAAIAKV
jgi:hypothetical protein